MDLSAIIIVVLLTGSFFGFVVWAAFHSRKNNSEKVSANSGEIEFAEVTNRNKQFSKK